jgi:formiminotetrahydrofolate cyclodeaminase
MSDYQEFYNKPFAKLLELACSKSHIPGGGSVTAMSVALGVSMGAMVANITLNKKGYEHTYEEVSKLLDIMILGIESIKKLTQEDMDAFDNFLSAYRLPKESDSQKMIRKDEIQKTTIIAAMVPLKIAETANELLFHNKRLSEIGSGTVVNDCAVASVILESAVRASILSVDINYVNIEDANIQYEIKETRDKLLVESKQTMEDTLSIVASRDKSF